MIKLMDFLYCEGPNELYYSVFNWKLNVIMFLRVNN